MIGDPFLHFARWQYHRSYYVVEPVATGFLPTIRYRIKHVNICRIRLARLCLSSENSAAAIKTPPEKFEQLPWSVIFIGQNEKKLKGQAQTS